MLPPGRCAAHRAAAADAVLVVTPEYNGSIPGCSRTRSTGCRGRSATARCGPPLAVIGGAFGQYGGVWAHDETRKSFGIAGPRVVEAIKLSVPFKALDGKHPRENAELVANLSEVVEKLVAEVG